MSKKDPLKDMTAEQLRAGAARNEAEKAESFERCDTDGFLSQWASGLSAQLKRRCADLVDNGKRSRFPALFDLEGNLVPAKLVTRPNRFAGYGTVETWFVWDNDECEGRPIAYIAAHPKRESTQTKKGYVEGAVMAPAWARFAGRGTGLSGQCWVETYRTDGGFSRDVEVITTNRYQNDI